MSNVEHLFENAMVALELNRTKEQWLQANDLNINGVSDEVIDVIWDLAIYTKYTNVDDPILPDYISEEERIKNNIPIEYCFGWKDCLDTIKGEKNEH